MKIYLATPRFRTYSRDIETSIKYTIKEFGYKLVSFEGLQYDIDNKLINVKDEIKDSDFFIAEVSNIDSNVMYKISVADSYNIPILLIKEYNKQIPIEISQFQIIEYERNKLKATLINSLKNILYENNFESFISDSSKTKESKKEKGKIFISYNRNDLSYLKRLKIHLKPFVKDELIDVWDDTQIKAGEKWKDEIENALNNCSVAILLISADFMASDFIVDNELPPLLEAAEKEGKTIIPVIVKPCRFTSDKNLSKYQSINDPEYPLSGLRAHRREKIYVAIADRIEIFFDLISK